MNQADSAMSRSRSQAENESESVDGDIFYHPLKMQRVSMRYPTDKTNNFLPRRVATGHSKKAHIFQPLPI